MMNAAPPCMRVCRHPCGVLCTVYKTLLYVFDACSQYIRHMIEAVRT
jgi:hypothetical protein